MVTSKRRQRQLARAKWQRQQVRRVRMASRQRKISVVVGVVVGVVVVVLLGWFVKNIISDENSRSPQSPAVPTDSFSTSMPTPSQNTGSTPATKPTTPAPTKSTKKPSTTGGN